MVMNYDDFIEQIDPDYGVPPANLNDLKRLEDNLINNVKKGDRGKDGYSPRKGLDYFDGENGRNPMTVSTDAPKSPQIGDLWYKV